MSQDQIIITDSAIEHIQNILHTELPNSKFRIAVESGGCKGLQYRFVIADDINSDDIVITRSLATILIDSTSHEFVKNCIIDYVETLGSAEFVVSNPNATAKCGCGTSFTI